MKKHTTAADLPTTEQIARERSRLRYKRRYGRTLRSTAAILLVVAALAVLVATLWMPVLRIYGSSMAPTLNLRKVSDRKTNLFTQLLQGHILFEPFLL